MSESRVELIDSGEFQPREWLRREVLWASLVTPYSHQMDGWLDQDAERALQQHNGNVSRRDLFAADPDPRFLSHAFINQGKNIAGLISSSILFKLSMPGRLENVVNVLEVQAQNVDKVLHRLPDVPSIPLQPEAVVLQKSVELVAAAINPDLSRMEARKNFLRAHKLLSVLASVEAAPWLDSSQQNEEGTLPALRIHDGGHPRSVGPKIHGLQVIFQRTVESEPFQQLATPDYSSMLSR